MCIGGSGKGGGGGGGGSTSVMRQNGQLLAAAGGGGGAGNCGYFEARCAAGGAGGGETGGDGGSPRGFNVTAFATPQTDSPETCRKGWCSAYTSEASRSLRIILLGNANKCSILKSLKAFCR